MLAADGVAPPVVRRIYVANLVAQMGIVVTGAVVRLTSSGLGCPTWPRCTGTSITPVEGQAEAWHKYVEFGNRLLTVVLMVLAVAALAAALWDARRRRESGLPARRVLTALMAVVLVVGMLVTASGPHAGDQRTQRLGLDPQTMAWLHADIVVLCVGLLAGLLVALRATGAPERPTRAGTHLLVAFLAQGFVGYVQFFTAEPWVLVAVHVLLATIIWWAMVRLLLATRTRGVVTA